MDDKDERHLRRRAIRWWANGVKVQVILKKVHRRRA